MKQMEPANSALSSSSQTAFLDAHATSAKSSQPSLFLNALNTLIAETKIKLGPYTQETIRKRGKKSLWFTRYQEVQALEACVTTALPFSASGKKDKGKEKENERTATNYEAREETIPGYEDAEVLAECVRILTRAKKAGFLNLRNLYLNDFVNRLEKLVKGEHNKLAEKQRNKKSFSRNYPKKHVEKEREERREVKKCGDSKLTQQPEEENQRTLKIKHQDKEISQLKEGMKGQKEDPHNLSNLRSYSKLPEDLAFEIKNFNHSNLRSPPKLPEELAFEIKNFNHSKLHRQTVYYVNRSLCGKLGPRTHGYIAIGTKNSRNQKRYAKIYGYGNSIMNTPYIVSDQLISAVNKSNIFSASTKNALEEFRGEKFLTTELFLRELLMKTQIDQNSNKVILLNATSPPSKELRALVSFNKRINKQFGTVQPLEMTAKRYVADQERFVKGGISLTCKAYPAIQPMTIYDLDKQQKLYIAYLEEKMGIGKGTKGKAKLSAKPSEAAELMPYLVKVDPLPNKKNLFSANCNKSAATLLQAAENESAHQQGRSSKTITGASFWAVGSKQRMFFWNPLKPNLPTIIRTLTDKNTFDNVSVSKQELANAKNHIIELVSSFPPEQCKKVLEQILDKKTALGQVFYTRRTGKWRNPSLTRGYLEKAKRMLENINACLGQEELSLQKPPTGIKA